ncbi:hypothetical protein E8E11_001868 [Didymella keratinophila]|nr:hypothetical protein E8E11_001868 [Didymella keratinophila]
MNEIFDPTILDVVLFGAAIDYGVKFWQANKTHEHQARIDTSWNRLGGIYVKCREAFVDLTRHMEKYPWRFSDTPEEFKQDMRAAGYSINGIDDAIAEMKRV